MTVHQMTAGVQEMERAVHRICDAGDHIEMGEAFYEALALPPIELRRAMRALARLEGSSTPDRLHERALQRLRALMQLDAEQARVIARAFDDAFLDLPDGWQERNREAELGAILNGLDGRSFGALAGIVPSLRDRFGEGWLLEQLAAPQGAPVAEIVAEPTAPVLEPVATA